MQFHLSRDLESCFIMYPRAVKKSSREKLCLDYRLLNWYCPQFNRRLYDQDGNTINAERKETVD